MRMRFARLFFCAFLAELLPCGHHVDRVLLMVRSWQFFCYQTDISPTWFLVRSCVGGRLFPQSGHYCSRDGRCRKQNKAIRLLSFGRLRKGVCMRRQLLLLHGLCSIMAHGPAGQTGEKGASCLIRCRSPLAPDFETYQFFKIRRKESWSIT